MSKLPKFEPTGWGVHDTPQGLSVLLQKSIPQVQFARKVSVDLKFLKPTKKFYFAGHNFILNDYAPSKKVLKFLKQYPFLSPSLSVKRRFFYATTETVKQLKELQKLHKADWLTPSVHSSIMIMNAANATNVSPLILHHVDLNWVHKNTGLLSALMTSSRHIIIEMPKGALNIEQYEFLEELENIPDDDGSLTDVGGYILKKEMRGEKWQM